MKIRLGTLRRILREEIVPRAGGRGAPTDSDAQVPGHLPNELPKSASLDDDISETDEQVVGDGLGNGEKDPNEFDKGEYDIASHLRGDEDKTSLGSPPDEVMEESRRLNHEIANYLARNTFLLEYPAGAGMVDPINAKGFYSDFDMEKDHHTGADIQGMWYRSPGREPATDGDPFRVEDPHARLGFHPPPVKDTTSPPAVNGEEGIAARRAQPIWQLNGTGDTSKMLGADAKPDSGEVGSEDESEEGEETGSEGSDGGTESGTEPVEDKGKKSSGSSSLNSRD